MNYLVPSYLTKHYCIGCGVKVSSKPKGSIKKATSVGVQKATYIWNTQQIIVNYKDHITQLI